MPRIRTIKPEFFTSDDILDLSPLTRLVYIGLWCHSDRNGCLKYGRALKSLILPEESNKFTNCIAELISNNHAIQYQVKSKKYLYLPMFSVHQRPHHTEKDSGIPEYRSELTVNEPLDNREKRERKGKEGKGEGKGTMSSKPIDAPKIIIDYLNQKTGKSFRTTEKHSKLICARTREGFTSDDIKAVIDRKCLQWINNPKMVEYLRPSTLFGGKFSEYHGELTTPLRLAPASKQAAIEQQNNLAGQQWLEEEAERHAHG